MSKTEEAFWKAADEFKVATELSLWDDMEHAYQMMLLEWRMNKQERQNECSGQDG